MKRAFIILGAAVLIVSAYLAWVLISRESYSVIIESEPEAIISVANSRGDSYKQIGGGSVVYKTSQEHALFFEVVLGESVTELSLKPEESNGRTIVVPLSAPGVASKIFDHPLSSYMRKDDVLYGVDKLSNTIVNVADDRFVPPEISFITVPYVSSVVWQDTDTYAYNRFAEGSGAVIRGRNQGADYFKSKLSGSSVAESIVSVKSDKNSPLAVLSSESIYVSTDFGKTMKSINNVDQCEYPFFKVAGDYIYYGKQPTVHEHVTETDDDIDDPDSNPYSVLYVYDFSGNLITSADIPDTHAINDVTWSEARSSFFLVSHESIFEIKRSGDVVGSVDLYVEPENIVAHKDSLFVFSKQQVSRYDPSTGFTQVYSSFGSDTFVKDSAVFETAGPILNFTVLNQSAYSGSIRTISLE